MCIKYYFLSKEVEEGEGEEEGEVGSTPKVEIDRRLCLKRVHFLGWWYFKRVTIFELKYRLERLGKNVI